MSTVGDLGLKPQPMIHVESMAEALRFYEALGAKLMFGSRDGDWSMIDFAGSRIGLLAHPPGDGKRETVELQFTSAQALEAVEEKMHGIDAAFVERGVADEAFGRMLKLRTPDGLLIKVIEVERDLVE
jgi:catechol 2,3-dioxygenase-like lactoylglutathione lyase family enzyme